ncbi:MAG: FAD:protein FMN transferase [Actinomycetaceae bacterium]|nr:FAD:protein FMN transferase [Actinomycetaceae bacterium]
MTDGGKARLRDSDLDFRTAFPAMGTVIDVRGIGEPPDHLADALAEHALARERAWSTFDPTSQISKLNQSAGSGRWVEVSDETAAFLHECIEFVQASNGAFSLTIGALSKLWDVRGWLQALALGHSPRFPSISEIEKARQTARPDALEWNTNGEFRLAQGASLDLGGVAKGRVADELLDIATQCGLVSALVSVGRSSIAARGEHSKGIPWRAGIRSLDDSPLNILGSIDLADESLATSGDYLQRLPDLVDGMIIHHVIDPRTGFPAQSGVRQATVVTTDGALAEVAATTLLVMGELPAHASSGYQWLAVRDAGYETSEGLAWNRPTNPA